MALFSSFVRLADGVDMMQVRVVRDQSLRGAVSVSQYLMRTTVMCTFRNRDLSKQGHVAPHKQSVDRKVYVDVRLESIASDAVRR